jgi:hypothetical protein
MAFMGMGSFGSLLAGVVGHQWGSRTVFLCGGLCAIIGGLLFAIQLPRIRELVRPLYIQKGLLTEIVQ